MSEWKRMTEEEMSKTDPLQRHTHPTAVLREIMDLIGRIGAKKFLNGAGYNGERDALFGCMFAFALRAHQNREFYMQQVSDPPDFELIAPTDRSTEGKPFDHANVEVVTVPQAVDQATDRIGFVIEILERTKLTKLYEAGTILLIVIKGSCGPELVEPLRVWLETNQSRLVNFGEIMMMHLVSVSKTESFIYRVTSLSTTWAGQFSLAQEFKRPLIEHPMIEKYGVHVERHQGAGN